MPHSQTSESAIHRRLAEIHRRHLSNTSGQVATYIPELAKADPNAFGIAMATLDGTVYEVGDSRQPFTIQSISKPFVYGLALEDRGQEHVLKRVGVEPTGEAFNSIVFDERGNRPFNPMVNAGAIATTAMVAGDSHQHRLNRILDLFQRFAGEPLTIDEAVYRSEKSTGHRNRAITYLELNSNMIEEPVEEHLDLYFRQCSILVTARHLAIMAATLANNGVNPVTGERALEPRYMRNLLSVMCSCGMYDFSGEWIYRVGLPAKSGVAGGIVAVLPGQFGIGVFSPPLDVQGNSVRGIGVCEDLSTHFSLHLFDKNMPLSVALRRSYRCNQVRSKRMRRPSHQAILDQAGSKVQVHVLQGDLFFASMERVIRHMASELTDVKYLVLDGRHISRLDASAQSLLADDFQHLGEAGVKLLFAGLPHLLRVELLLDTKLPWSMHDFVDSIDEALEWCEDRLIEQAERAGDGDAGLITLSEMDIAAHLDAEELDLLSSLLVRRSFAPGETIIREGAAADEVFMLIAGSATISVQVPGNNRRRRLGAVGEGVTFGELALFEGGTRSADVIADVPTECFVLPVAALHDVAPEKPNLLVKLLRNVGRTLSRRLRQANAEIRTLD
ncbi:glutaminase A [Humisphaera borealis]|uniref:Glutaminase n=1 Tax=Humisphaera borealis TaxID=2807512 RepID=A0A7M2WTW7_9BACT|nr:glutaminase A [Humisphaera borealis]QOV88251.1 glutaminase A [Humisphaera borealis]